MAFPLFATGLRYQSSASPGFAKSIAAVPGHETLLSCIQCGTCSGTCPLSIYMDFTPRRIIALTRAGFADDVLSSRTIWLCASCYSCAVECPKEIKITDVMYTLKRHAITRGVYPEKFAVPILASEFFGMVRKYGRSSEGRLLVNLYRKTGLLKSLKNTALGWRLFRKGRIGPGQDSIKNRSQLRALLEAVAENGRGVRRGQ